MRALFKTQYSIGKSILSLDDPEKLSEGGYDSVFQIAEEEGLKTLTFVEDNMHGFLEAHKKCKERGIKFEFGLRMDWEHGGKIVILAKNDDGCKGIYKIHNKAYKDGDGVVRGLDKAWSNNLILCIPFYDSFLHENNFYFSKHSPDLKEYNPVFFWEDNGLPFDSALQSYVYNFADNNNYRKEKVKTIYYKNKKDFVAFQTFKIICNRANFNGRERNLNDPGFAHFSSDRFSYESYKEEVKII